MLRAGEGWSGDLLTADREDLENVFTSEVHVKNSSTKKSHKRELPHCGEKSAEANLGTCVVASMRVFPVRDARGNLQQCRSGKLEATLISGSSGQDGQPHQNHMDDIAEKGYVSVFPLRRGTLTHDIKAAMTKANA